MNYFISELGYVLVDSASNLIALVEFSRLVTLQHEFLSICRMLLVFPKLYTFCFCFP